MVAYNFQAQFADDVEHGRKLQTIRSNARAKVGDKLQLYTGMRTKNCRKLRDAICVSVIRCQISQEGIAFLSMEPGTVPGFFNVLHQGDEADRLAREDGFCDFASMLNWFQATYKTDIFSGYVIQWSKP